MKKSKKIKSLLTKSTLSEDECANLLLLVRKIMESTKTQKIYPTLKFFCDWTLHNKIDHSFRASQAIMDLQSATNQYKNTDSTKVYLEIPKILFTPFQEEFFRFLKYHGFSTEISDNASNWSKFLRIFFDIIEDTPAIIQATEETGLKEDPLAPNIWIKAINIGKEDMPQFSNNPTYFLQLTTSNSIKIRFFLNDLLRLPNGI